MSSQADLAASTGNRRVDAILDLARRTDHHVQPAPHVPGCWMVHGDTDRYLLVYAGSNDRALVQMVSGPGGSMDRITQAKAKDMLSWRLLFTETARRAAGL